MSDDDFDRVFGGGPIARPRFADRVAQGDALAGRIDPRPAMAVEAASVATPAGEYRAFGHLPSGNVNLCCEVRWWLEATAIPQGLIFPYRLLLQVGFIGDSELRIVLPDTVLQVTGYKLDPLRQALMRQQVTFIQQFNPRIWSTGDSSLPTVDVIDVLKPY